MGILFGDGGINFAVSVSLVFLLTRFRLPAKLLVGLRIFKALPADAVGDVERRASGPVRAGKKERKLAKAAARQQIHVDGAEQMVRYPLPTASVEKALFYPDFALLVMFGIALVCNYAVAASPLRALRLASFKWPLCMAAAYPSAVAWALIQAEIMTKAVLWRDKLLLLLLCAATTAAAFSVLHAVPSSTLDFRWMQPGRELSQSMAAMYWKLTHSMDFVGVKVPDALLKLLLSVTAGPLSGLLVPGAVRLAKCLALGLGPPPSTRQYISSSAANAGLMRLSAASPLLGALFWIRPMVHDLWGVSDGFVQTIRAYFLLALAAIHLAAVRTHVQAYLNLALVDWWTNKHAVTSAEVGTRAGELIRMKVDFVNILICKVCIEMLAPAAIWLSCASLLLFCQYHDQAHSTGGFWVPTKLVAAASSFVAWWTCCCWFGFTAIVLFMYKFGLLAV